MGVETALNGQFYQVGVKSNYFVNDPIVSPPAQDGRAIFTFIFELNISCLGIVDQNQIKSHSNGVAYCAQMLVWAPNFNKISNLHEREA